MRFRRTKHDDSENLNLIAEALQGVGTPFQALKVANQELQFSIVPEFGLTRERYFWNSNGTDWDKTNFSEDDGEITLSTSATGSDTARLRSAYSGKYISQTLSEPGIQVVVDSSNINIDSSTGEASLTHGEILCGPFWWDSSNSKIDTGFGVRMNSTDLSVFWVSGGTHFGDSPVSQSDWNIDTLDGTGKLSDNPSGIQYDPSDGWVFNGLYWWYNSGKILLSFVDPVNNTLVPFHEFNPRLDEPGKPNLKTPNLPVQLRMDNDGTGSSLTASVGGIQYTSYGSTVGIGVEKRETPIIVNNTAISTAETEDPSSTPGDYIASIRRQSDGFRDIEVETKTLTAQSDQTVVIYQWMEMDDATALSGTPSFSEPNIPNSGDETNVEYDTAASGFSPSEAVLESVFKIEGGGGPSAIVSRKGTEVETRIPIGGTRVFTGVDTGNNASLDMIFNVLEGF